MSKWLTFSYIGFALIWALILEAQTGIPASKNSWKHHSQRLPKALNGWICLYLHWLANNLNSFKTTFLPNVFLFKYSAKSPIPTIWFIDNKQTVQERGSAVCFVRSHCFIYKHRSYVGLSSVNINLRTSLYLSCT